MTTDTEDTTDASTNEWHGLPGMIGEAITTPDYGSHMWGDYLVRRVTDGQGRGDIVIYRIVEAEQNKSDIPRGQEFVTEIGERFIAGRSCGRLEAPDAGWNSEIEILPEDIFGGFE